MMRFNRIASWSRGALGVPDLTYEQHFSGLVAGIDEAGRGPLAGPVVAAAVILSAGPLPIGLNDSKKLSPARRTTLAAEIRRHHRFGIGQASVAEIDALNILNATYLAMRRALAALGTPVPMAVLVDGNRDPKLGVTTQLIIGGDGLSASIAAASIIAKVTRDQILADMAQECPGYGFERHKGYGTADHLAALARLGPTAHHRRSFAPVTRLLRSTPAEISDTSTPTGKISVKVMAVR